MSARSTTTTSPSTEDSSCIDETTGRFEGLDPGNRPGRPPPDTVSADLQQAAGDAGCDLELDLPDEGNTHIPVSKPTDYGTEPPTSGDHDQVPLADGTYLTEPDPRYVVHSMEHGRVVIAYQPDLPEDDQLALKGLLENNPDGMVLIPDSDMPYDVAAAAWTNLLGCKSYSPEALGAIAAFRDEFPGKGPEAIPL